ncbi:hypothetical protein CEXT_603241 [Caerostris extrusa]|uniref:Uncharacterized protein n=1 Tax=Caerostris extrusa TaxID=172846 RepID=A0AAV4WC56_CAEEX|nr:hypothetical protein CEXT_603241 [Caerostris extrusa]
MTLPRREWRKRCCKLSRQRVCATNLALDLNHPLQSFPPHLQGRRTNEITYSPRMRGIVPRTCLLGSMKAVNIFVYSAGTMAIRRAPAVNLFAQNSFSFSFYSSSRTRMVARRTRILAFKS